jgi:phage repressor protein C with HTH and peptisase S24 domain
VLPERTGVNANWFESGGDSEKRLRLLVAMKPKPKTLAERFALAREESGLGSNELDRRIGVGQFTTKIESGDKRNPRAETLAKAAVELKVRAEWLAAGIGPMRDEAALGARSEPRYPNCERAIDMARAGGLEIEDHDAFIKAATSLRDFRFGSGEDRELSFWQMNFSVLYERSRSGRTPPPDPWSPPKRKGTDR